MKVSEAPRLRPVTITRLWSDDRLAPHLEAQGSPDASGDFTSHAAITMEVTQAGLLGPGRQTTSKSLQSVWYD